MFRTQKTTNEYEMNESTKRLNEDTDFFLYRKYQGKQNFG